VTGPVGRDRAGGARGKLSHVSQEIRQGAGHNLNGVAGYVERASPNMITAVLVAVAGFTFLLKIPG
jgi:hypothetical protein